jgi:hypothetical protein
MKHYINVRGGKENFYSLAPFFQGERPDGQTLSFTNYYMEIDKKPFFGICGEIHYSRIWEEYWEDEIVKMKMGGVNIIAAYVFWIHHEEEEGIFNFSGRRNLRKFVELCAKHNLYAIVRIGPFDHGEVRNGGIPDWMYGKPCEVRSLDDLFLSYTKRLYSRLAEELSGLYYKDGGPIIAAQIDNEYMHSAAPWEITTGISNEWLPGGDRGEAYLLRLRDMAWEAGIAVPFYTCTGWGGAPTPVELMPLWGGYAFRPWLFYRTKGEHPATEEYIYRDNHNNDITETYNFKPFYLPETKPYLCCEMGGGMFCSYNYRFQLEFESVDAMANIKTASGCNMLGYYMFHGGTNPKGKHTPFLNEGQTPKLSYDFQAPLGEYGQVRDSFRRLRCIHFLTKTFEGILCTAKTILPDGSQDISPKDADTLRFALRINETGEGFLFINNYQDHVQNQAKAGETIVIQLPKNEIVIENIDLAAGENCVLPINLNIGGIHLRYALAQPLCMFAVNSELYAFFFTPKGMRPSYYFDADVNLRKVSGPVTVEQYSVLCSPDEMTVFSVETNRSKVHFATLTRGQSLNFQYVDYNGRPAALLTDATVIASQGSIRLEHDTNQVGFSVFPGDVLPIPQNAETLDGGNGDLFSRYRLEKDLVEIIPKLEQIGPSRYLVTIPPLDMGIMKDVILQIDYTGDIGQAFIDGDMIADNFWNGAVWEIGLREFAERLASNPLTLYIVPIKEGSSVNVESTMAGRREENIRVSSCVHDVKAAVLYEWELNRKEQ